MYLLQLFLGMQVYCNACYSRSSWCDIEQHQFIKWYQLVAHRNVKACYQGGGLVLFVASYPSLQGYDIVACIIKAVWNIDVAELLNLIWHLAYDITRLLIGHD